MIHAPEAEPMRQGTLALIVVAALLSPSLLLAQTGHGTPPPPIIFAVPRLEFNGPSGEVFDGVDLGFAVPLTPRQSVTGSWLIGTDSGEELTATYNWDIPLRNGYRGRLSAGLMGNDFGVGLSAHRMSGDWGTGAFARSVDGELRAGLFLSTPLKWGMPVGSPKAERSTAWGDTSGGVAAMGAVATISAENRRDKGQTRFVTGTAWYPRTITNWARAGQDGQSAGASPSEFAAPATQAWESEIGGAVRGGPAIVSEVVYVGTADGEVQALKLTDGSPLWSVAVGSPITRALTAAGGRVYVGTEAGYLVCVRPPANPQALLGAVEWRFDARAAIHSCPLVTSRGLILFGDDAGVCHALNLQGQEVWRVRTGGRIADGPSTYGTTVGVFEADGQRRSSGLVYVASEDGVLYALREADGETVWTYTTDGSLEASPVVGERAVVVVTEAGRAYACEPATGRLLWKVATRVRHPVTPAMANGRVYVVGRDGLTVALNAEDGRRLWATQVHGPVVASPVVTGRGHLFLASASGMLDAVRLSDGKLVWAANTRSAVSSGTALASKFLVLGVSAGRVLAYVPGGTWRIDAPLAVALAQPSDLASAPDFPAPTVKPVGPDVPEMALTLIARSDDPTQPTLQVTNRPQVTVSGTAPAGTALVLVNDAAATLHEGRYEATVELPGPGAYPVTVKMVDSQGRTRMDSRVVMVSGPECPSSGAPLFIAPEGEGAARRLTFEVAAHVPTEAARVATLEIRDASGKAIRAWSEEGVGARSYTWDGKDQWGKPARDGQYLAVYTVRDLDGRARSLYQPVIVENAGR
jgi:outer membrane protein assembly factor BamB